MQIRIAVQHQNACRFSDRILGYSEDDNNELYVNTIDNFYVIVHISAV